MSVENSELAFVYSILNVIRNAEHNNDERLSERLIRDFVRAHRPDSMRKYYNNGQTVDDEVFQLIPLVFTKLPTGEFMATLPKIIRFENNYGFFLDKYGTSLPIMTSQEYQLNKTNPFNNKFIACKTHGNNVFLRIPTNTNGLDIISENYTIINGFVQDIYSQELANVNNNTNEPVTIELDLHAVLLNPDDCPTYDWENDIFPFPAERLPELRQQILAREFNIMTQSKRDEIQNARGIS